MSFLRDPILGLFDKLPDSLKVPILLLLIGLVALLAVYGWSRYRRSRELAKALGRMADRLREVEEERDALQGRLSALDRVDRQFGQSRMRWRAAPSCQPHADPRASSRCAISKAGSARQR